MHCHPARALPAWGARGDPTPLAQTSTPLEPPASTEQPWQLLPTQSTRLGGWDLPSGRPPLWGQSQQRIPAGEEGSLRAAPNGPSKVSCLPQESSAPPALVSIRHCPALEVICCFINYLHTMGPLSAPEQHTLAFRSNALTSAHPGQTKCLCAVFPLPSPAPPPTSPRADHGHGPFLDRRPRGCSSLPGATHTVGVTGLDGHPGCLGGHFPRTDGRPQLRAHPAWAAWATMSRVGVWLLPSVALSSLWAAVGLGAAPMGPAMPLRLCCQGAGASSHGCEGAGAALRVPRPRGDMGKSLLG